MRTLLFLLLTSSLSAQISSTSWEDFFTGTIMGINTTLTGEIEGDTWIARANADGYIFNLEGFVSGETCLGTMTDAQNGESAAFLAELGAESLKIIIEDINPETGQEQLVEFVFAKTDPATYVQTASASQSSDASQSNFQVVQGPKDQRLVGSWRFTDSYISGQFSFATDYHMEIHADGNFFYGKGRTMGGGPDSSIDSGESGYDQGSWKTENGSLYVHDGTDWHFYAKYYQEGNSLMLTYQNGNKQVWERL